VIHVKLTDQKSHATRTVLAEAVCVMGLGKKGVEIKLMGDEFIGIDILNMITTLLSLARDNFEDPEGYRALTQGVKEFMEAKPHGNQDLSGLQS
jgi:hypothetical protein